MKPWLVPCVLTLLTALLSACAGGGGDSNDNDGDSAKSTQQRLSGSVEQEGGSDQDPISVKILSYDGDDNPIDSETTVASYLSQSDSWIYDAEVDMARTGGYLVVSMNKDGYAGFNRKVEFDAPRDIQVLGRVVEAAEAQVTVESNGYVLRSGRSRNSFTFALVEDGRGQRSLVGGASNLLAARAANATDVLVIDIPASSVPQDTTELQGRMASFDPNDAEESESFPGEYADSDGNDLLSVAFQFNEITTQDGQSLGKAVQRARANGAMSRAETEPTIISRHIPEGSCSAMESLGDSDDTKSGFQIPVYTYNPNSGLWDLLGTGTVYENDGTAVPSSQSTFDCTTVSYYLEIEVSNEEFNRKWWNLDYPLTFEQPVQLCARVRIEDQDGAPLSGTSIFLKDDDGRSFSDTYGYTNDSGEVTLNTTLIDGSEDRSARIRYWGFNSAAYVSSTVTLSEDCTRRQTVTVERRDKCLIRGQVNDDAGPLKDVLVYAYGFGDQDWHYGYGQTNAGGEFSLNAVCNMDYTVYAYGSEASFQSFKSANVDNSLGEDEQSDNGEVVQLDTITIENQGPMAYAWFYWSSNVGDTNVIDGETYYSLDSGPVDVWGYAWDYEGDWPVSMTLQLIDESGVVQDSVTQELTEEDYFADEAGLLTLDVPVNGYYRLGGSATDNKGNTSDINNYGTID